MRIVIKKDYQEMSLWAANYVIEQINQFNPSAHKPFVLGLCTGSTPIGMYQNLVEAYKQGKVSFKNVITFNMDEYVGLAPSHDQSYHYFMYDNLFNHIDIDPKNIHILDGLAADKEVECMRFEQAMQDAGGVDLFLGGVGADSHIAFNEPGSSLASRTREVFLTQETIRDNSRFFEGDIKKVPTSALTVGIGTIMDAKEVLILINGHHKAHALSYAVEGHVSHQYPITVLQLHPHSIIVCDDDACDELRVKTYRYLKEIES